MAKNSKITGLVLGSIFAGMAMTAANDAMALDRGCQNADVVRAGIAAEDQFVLLTAISPTPEQPKNIFTSNSAGTLGYQIEQGIPGELCVAIKYTDIKVNGDPNLAAPAWALFGANTSHDQWLRQTQTDADSQVLMGATVLRTVKDSNGQELRGGFMMVTRGKAPEGAKTMYNSGVTTLTVDNGNLSPDSLILANIEKVQPNYDLYASRQTKVASNSQMATLVKN